MRAVLLALAAAIVFGSCADDHSDEPSDDRSYEIPPAST